MRVSTARSCLHSITPNATAKTCKLVNGAENSTLSMFAPASHTLNSGVGLLACSEVAPGLTEPVVFESQWRGARRCWCCCDTRSSSPRAVSRSAATNLAAVAASMTALHAHNASAQARWCVFFGRDEPRKFTLPACRHNMELFRRRTWPCEFRRAGRALEPHPSCRCSRPEFMHSASTQCTMKKGKHIASWRQAMEKLLLRG